MAKKLSELRAGMSQAAREMSDGIARQMLAEMPLNELRQARGLSQKVLAEVLRVHQPLIAMMESGLTCTCLPCAATSMPWAANST